MCRGRNGGVAAVRFLSACAFVRCCDGRSDGRDDGEHSSQQQQQQQQRQWSGVAIVGAAVVAVVYGYRYDTRAKAAADRGQPRRRARTRGRKGGAATAPKHRHYQLLGAENGGLASINADAVDRDYATLGHSTEDYEDYNGYDDDPRV